MRDEGGLAVGAPDRRGRGRGSRVEVELRRRRVGQRQAERHVVLVAADDTSEVELEKQVLELVLAKSWDIFLVGDARPQFSIGVWFHQRGRPTLLVHLPQRVQEDGRRICKMKQA